MMVILTYQPLWFNSVSWWLEYTCMFSLRFDTRSDDVVGLYDLSWEFSISFAFDWSFITGARKFKWPMVRTWSFTHSLVCEVYLFRPRSSTSAIDICSWHPYVLCTWLKALCHIHKLTDTSYWRCAFQSITRYILAFIFLTAISVFEIRQIACQPLLTFMQVGHVVERDFSFVSLMNNATVCREHVHRIF